MEEWKQRLDDISEVMGADDEYTKKCILWCIGSLNSLRDVGILSDGSYNLSKEGQRLFETLRIDFRPTDQEIATVIAGMVSEEDQQEITLLLSTYRDHGGKMIDDFKGYSESYKYN